MTITDSEMSPPLATPPSTADVPATEGASADLDDVFLVLNGDQYRQIQQFRENIRACQTDKEKYALCTEIRDDLLGQYAGLESLVAGLEFLIAAYYHIIEAECTDYKTKRRTIQKGDTAQWEHFGSVAQNGLQTQKRCVSALKTVDRF